MWRRQPFIWKVLKVLFTLMLFLFSIDLLKEAFQLLGINAVESLIIATSNPFIGLFIGLLITAIIQSSSTTTTMVVALVASGNIMIHDAIPIIMGANIGTTLTSTMVSLAYINRPTDFTRALSAGVIHDFFNILTVVVLLPLEINYEILSAGSTAITGYLLPGTITDSHPILFSHDLTVTTWLTDWIDNSLIIILLAFLLLFVSIKLLIELLTKLLIGKSKDRLQKYVFNNPFKSFAWGAVVTASVQSSSITTSLIVPLTASGKLLIKNVAPFIMGANIGTTITAFIAALFISEAALSLAVAHLLFNLFGVLLFLPVKFMREKLIFLAVSFGNIVVRHRILGLIYILLTFFLIPFALIYFNQ